MKIIEQSAEILPERENILEQLEERGRVCYQSQDKITPGSAEKFVRKIIESGHNSVLEMARIALYDSRNSIGTHKFLDTSYPDCYVSGSIRGWMEIDSRFKKMVTSFIFNEGGRITGHIPCPIRTNDWDHTYVCVKLITNRAMTHELVRHRPCSFLQESQRYVRYEDGVTFIKPVWYEYPKSAFEISPSTIWKDSSKAAEYDYILMRHHGSTPQQARDVLPNSTKTELLVYCNLRQWNHIFYMRTSAGADPQMRALMIPLLEVFKEKFPGHFDVLKPSVG